MNRYASQQYNSDEVTRIIRRALKLSNEDTISYSELMDTARQIGLDPQNVETAIKQKRRAFKKEKIRNVVMNRRKAGFQWHLWSYIIVNAALLLTNKLTPGPWWFHWSVLGWGIGLAFHFKAVYLAKPRKIYSREKARQKRAKCLWVQNW